MSRTVTFSLKQSSALASGVFNQLMVTFHWKRVTTHMWIRKTRAVNRLLRTNLVLFHNQHRLWLQQRNQGRWNPQFCPCLCTPGDLNTPTNTGWNMKHQPREQLPHVVAEISEENKWATFKKMSKNRGWTNGRRRKETEEQRREDVTWPQQSYKRHSINGCCFPVTWHIFIHQPALRFWSI